MVIYQVRHVVQLNFDHKVSYLNLILLYNSCYLGCWNLSSFVFWSVNECFILCLPKCTQILCFFCQVGIFFSLLCSASKYNDLANRQGKASLIFSMFTPHHGKVTMKIKKQNKVKYSNYKQTKQDYYVYTKQQN